MRKNHILMPVESLNPGLVVADPFIDSKGVIILNEGMVLNSQVISKLQERYPHKSIAILDEYIDEIFTSKEDKKNKIISTEKKLGQITTGMKSILHNIEKQKSPNIKLVKGMSVQLMESFHDYNIVLEGILRERPVDEYTQRHCVNVSILSIMLGKWMSLPENEILMLGQSALLHDIGKAKVNSRILNKPSKLSPIEFEIMKKHSVLGYTISKEINNISQSILMGILMHHEKIDGSGYPLGLSGDKIHIFAKIIAIADIFDAMTSTRCYHKRESPFSVLEMFHHDLWNKVDPGCLMSFIKNITPYYEGEIVRLSNGHLAKIIKMNPLVPAAPIVSTQNEFLDLSTQKNISVTEVVSTPLDL